MKAAQARGKGDPDYDPMVFYGDLVWTRVISRTQVGEEVVETFPFGVDIAADKKTTKFKVKARSMLGKELYNPENYEPEELPLKVEQRQIPEEEVKEWGRVATSLRTEVNARAGKLQEGEGGENSFSDDEAHSHKVIAMRSFRRKRDLEPQTRVRGGFESRQVKSRLKPTPKRKLEAETIRAILLAVLREKLSHKEVAIMFQVTPALVHKLLKSYKDDPESLQKYEAKQ